jgi:hypothetical protein
MLTEILRFHDSSGLNLCPPLLLDIVNHIQVHRRHHWPAENHAEVVNLEKQILLSGGCAAMRAYEQRITGADGGISHP